MQNLDVKVLDNSKGQGEKLLFFTEVSGSFRVGRQDENESNKIALIQSHSSRSCFAQKLVIACADEREYSRHFAEIEVRDEEVQIRNTSHQVIYADSKPIEPNQTRLVEIPADVTLINRTIRLGGEAASTGEMESSSEFDSQNDLDSHFGGSIISLLQPVEPPNLRNYVNPTMSLVDAAHEANIDSKRLLELLQTMLQIFQDSPNSQHFFDRAARAMIQLLGLDHVLIAFHESHLPGFVESADTRVGGNQWRRQAFQCNTGVIEADWAPSSLILRTIESEKKTVYQIPDVITASLASVECLVASPLLNSENKMIGFIYGDRNTAGSNNKTISEAEAKFVELFANGIAFGLERLNQERQISDMRSRFVQFFTPQLARQLESDATLLEPRSAEVSVMFADIRGFSRISERIGPQKTISWINSVMNEFSDCVFKYDGVVVDYIGDEIMAMWGAPVDRANHAELAVKAALEMQASLPRINQQWEAILGESMEIGIGINSGTAQVGNTGSDRKFKYGPLGDVVNVSSRLQGATKQLGTKILVTESTAGMLPLDILSRRIRSVRFVNVQRAVTVYEVPFQPDQNWIQLKTEYEKGLALYEQGQLPLASQQMAAVINQFTNDGPSVRLLSDSVNGLSSDSDDFDPVWQLSQK